MVQRGEESGNQPFTASASNAGGSWTASDAAARTQGGVACGPFPDPILEEASNANFSNIVTLPILPEPNAGLIQSSVQFVTNTLGLNLKEGFLGMFNSIHNQTGPENGRWYHAEQRRVPPLWECDTNDSACMYEAEMQFLKEREVNRQILAVLEERQRMCWTNMDAGWQEHDKNIDPCQEITMFKRQADMNYSTKYKNLNKWGLQSTKALMKQKNRFIEKRWLERQGKSYEELQNMFHEPLTTAYMLDCMKWS